jgi:hypothetical protein
MAPLKCTIKLVKPKDGVHDPVVFFHESRIIDFLAVGNSLDKCFEIVLSGAEKTQAACSISWNFFCVEYLP